MLRSWIVRAAVGLVVVVAFVCLSGPLPGQNGDGQDRVLSKVTFIHFKKGHGKPADPGIGGGKKPQEGYYSYIAKGAKWKTVEDVLLNPNNSDGVPALLICNAVDGGVNEWETPGSAIFDIFGTVAPTETGPDGKPIAYNKGEYRGYNTISFGSYPNEGVIAVATVWGYFSGPLSQREIVETHILFNDYFEWGDAAFDGSVMDVQNIATHELGHCAGMGDVYETAASEETMYGYSTEGETKKRDLYKGDITGITKLYQ